jgi:hypothetical protein
MLEKEMTAFSEIKINRKISRKNSRRSLKD